MQATFPHNVLLAFCSALSVPFLTGAAPVAPPAPDDPGVEVLRQPGPTAGRGSTGIEWVRVHPPGESPCPPYTASSEIGWGYPGRTVEDVWCFEGAGGDSSWPVRPGQHWDHWSKFDPPGGSPSRWHVTSRHGGGATGAFNAWVGCDSIGTIDACDDVAFWVFQEGYGDDWNYALVLECSGQSAASGGTIEFDLRYDVEELYDYVYVEYLRNATGTWQAVVDSTGAPAVFDGVSGGGNYGSSVWLTNRRFVLPAQSGSTKIRWRAESDGAWSDADGSEDTDGMGAIDNVTVTFASGGAVVSDDFETGGFGGVTATIGTAAWSPSGLLGPAWDGWHFVYEPTYQSPDSPTCTFDDDWMWSAKEGVVPPEGNGFDFFLVSPAIDVSGWTGGVVQYDEFFTNNNGKRPHGNREVARTYDPSLGWSLWNDFDIFIIPDVYFWSRNEARDLTEFLGPSVDSLQVAWELVNFAGPGDSGWGQHGGVRYFIDNVSFGSYDATQTVFTARVIDVLSDTFSRVDPAHTPFLQNSDEGDWVGVGGSRAFAAEDSLSVEVTDTDGLANATVELWFRHDDATGPAVAAQAWTAWVGKPMDLSQPDIFNTPGWGTYRMTFGDDSGIGFDAGGEDGTGAADGFLWKAGTTVQYYVRVVDDASNESVWPATAADPMPVYLEWSVLPFGVNTAGAKSGLDGVGGDVHLLLVGDSQRSLLDFEHSAGFSATGGLGDGDFGEPAFASPERLVERALTLLYGGSANPAAYDPRWDRYDVQGAGSSVQREPRGTSLGAAIGGYGDDDGEPLYDAILWLQGTFDEHSYAATTRLELATYLDGGGRLLSSGDDVVFHLDPNGGNADSTFVRDYLGCDLASAAHDATIDRTLHAAGAVSGSLDGVTLGIYGACPIFRTFDRMALASPVGATATVLMTYEGGDAADNGTAAVIKCVRSAGGGVAVHSAFDLSALLSDGGRACFLDAVLVTDFGLPATAWGGCTNSGVSAPILASPGWVISKAAPNPFRAGTSVELRLPVRSRVSIEVYDVLGRKVRTLADETMPAGSWVQTWDGRGDDGERAGGGIYFLRVEAGEHRATRKAVLLR